MNCKFLIERFIIRWLKTLSTYNGSDQNFQPIIYSLLLDSCQSGLMQIMSKLF